MYEKFTDRARKVMQLANQEAQRFNHEYIGTEHILLGLVKEGAGVAANVLKNLNLDFRKIREEVEKIVQSGPDMVTMGKLPQTPRAKKVIEYSIEEARGLNHSYVGTEHLLLGLLRESEGVGAQVLMNLGLKLEEVREEILNLLGHNPSDRPTVKPAAAPCRMPTLDSAGLDLTALAKDGRLSPVVERQNEIERLLLVLGCRNERNALLVGPRGVGKSSLVHGLARLIAGESAPPPLRGHRIVQLSLCTWMIETRDDSGKLMVRVQAAANEARRAGNVLLFVDDLFAFAYDSRLAKAVLDASDVPWIATVTAEAYPTFAKDEVLGRNWQPVFVAPPSMDQAVAMLRALRPSYRDREQLEIRDDALAAAVELSERHLPDSCLPGKAVRVLEQSIALLRLKQPPPPAAVRELETRIEQLQQGKEAAIAATDFERAAQLRNEEDAAKKERIRLLEEWQAAAKTVPGVVDAALVEEVIGKLTGVHFRGGENIRAKPERM